MKLLELPVEVSLADPKRLGGLGPMPSRLLQDELDVLLLGLMKRHDLAIVVVPTGMACPAHVRWQVTHFDNRPFGQYRGLFDNIDHVRDFEQTMLEPRGARIGSLLMAEQLALY